MQRSYAAVTDDRGEYLFPQQFSAAVQNAFHVTIFAAGQQMVYQYQVFREGQQVSDFEFELQPAACDLFRFVDDSGSPLANADVFIFV